MMTPEDRERVRDNAQAALERAETLNGMGGSPEYSSDERPFPDEILELLDELDMWRAAREDALDEMERAEDTRDAIMADLRKERARIKAVHELAEDNIALRAALARAAILAETRINLALEILDGRFRPTDRIGDLHAALTSILKGEL